ncbi:MAG: 50S ribosomal protein L18 [Bacteroidetes bacterium]|jgi:large subunit ribosomal protein L18|nr:50S ribosomal protein L18 [Bacteroidota bacterium]MBK9672045.1 50S ribosomal protein L18 [Bacteroidota bacterium]MBK9800463.1 50S ribosomal protein L18 [Bacteroidota bacterium]MBP6413313.1 50S ribosomal protein L18 [Bacteroidia bacterium]HRH63155.1 50S ribosomal protein L18 [Bacteroidia bacterium]
MAVTKSSRRDKIKKRVRKVVSGTTESPRLSVFRSNKQIYAQIIDDSTGKTLVAASSKVADIANQKVNKVDQAKLVGKAIAEKAVGAGIKSIRFDRNGYLYHGRVKSLAEGAREGGLQF